MKRSILWLACLAWVPFLLGADWWLGGGGGAGNYLNNPTLPPSLNNDWNCNFFDWNDDSQAPLPLAPMVQVFDVTAADDRYTCDTATQANCIPSTFATFFPLPNGMAYVSGAANEANNRIKRVLSISTAGTDFIQAAEPLTDEANVTLTFDYPIARAEATGGWSLTGTGAASIVKGVENNMMTFINGVTTDNAVWTMQWNDTSPATVIGSGSGGWVGMYHGAPIFLSSSLLISSNIATAGDKVEEMSIFFGLSPLDTSPFNMPDYIGLFHADVDDDAGSELKIISDDVATGLSAAGFTLNTGVVFDDATPINPADLIVSPFEWNKYDLLIVPISTDSARVSFWFNNRLLVDSVDVGVDAPDDTRIGFNLSIRNDDTLAPDAAGVEMGPLRWCQSKFNNNGVMHGF